MILQSMALLFAIPMTPAANYTAERLTVDGSEIVRLGDALHKTEVSVIPALGNNAFEMKVNGKNIFWSPYQSLRELKEKPVQVGNPFLFPWANRIDGDAYWANGKKYLLNPDLKNYRYDNNRKPIHGLLVYAKEWRVIEVRADNESASVTSRLEFWRRPDWMAQFPFAHVITMTYRLSEGVLEVATSIENLASEPMPLSLGFHTYYRIEDSPRDEWKIHVAARDQVVASEMLIPTGERKAVALPDAASLRDHKLDDAFTGLIRDPRGRAEFWAQGKTQKIKVMMGPKYDVAIVFAPPGREFVCFEPMVGLTNVFNLSQAGIYKDLQSIPPGGTWKESFWITAEGYK